MQLVYPSILGALPCGQVCDSRRATSGCANHHFCSTFMIFEMQTWTLCKLLCRQIEHYQKGGVPLLPGKIARRWGGCCELHFLALWFDVWRETPSLVIWSHAMNFSIFERFYIFHFYSFLLSNSNFGSDWLRKIWQFSSLTRKCDPFPTRVSKNAHNWMCIPHLSGGMKKALLRQRRLAA